ncbi:hypothetical protein HN51_019650 [Arachis hypogaea]|uniref:Uncharacterized protein n=1 Tax=Arachis hypogaea TaxID=3818 RepID=A0A445BYB5_ARAHY|nr:hypothetical protein Ahy_A08g039923 isoform B [Arachis hypogaea]
MLLSQSNACVLVHACQDILQLRFHSESSMITREAAVKLMPSAQAVIEARSIFETPPGSSNLSITLPRSKSSS